MGSRRLARARERARRVAAFTIALSNPRARGKQPPGRLILLSKTVFFE